MDWERVLADANSRIDRDARQGISVLTICDDPYPKLLRLIPDPPLVLFVKGNTAALSAAVAVAVVGTRNATERGQQVASISSANDFTASVSSAPNRFSTLRRFRGNSHNEIRSPVKDTDALP